MSRSESLELNLTQWGIVLRAIRAEISLCREAGSPTDLRDLRELTIIEDQIIDLAFEAHLDSPGLKKGGE